MEPLLGYHPCGIGFLTSRRETGGGTMSGGEFDWGGRLRKGIGGAQRFPQNGWKPFEERKGRRELTVTPTGGAGTKVGLSDPVVLSGNAIAQRIKATLG